MRTPTILDLGRTLRRMLLLPTGKRRAPRRIVTADTTMIPPRPTVPPPLPAVPDRAEVFDAVMRRIAMQASRVQSETRVLVAAGSTGSGSFPTSGTIGERVPRPRPAEPAPHPQPVPRPRPGKMLLADADTAPIPRVRVTLPAVRPVGTVVPWRTLPVVSAAADDLLVSEDWKRLFGAAMARTDVVSYVVRPAVPDDTAIIDAVPDPAGTVTVPHLCKVCLNLSSGEQLGGRYWRCSTCCNTSQY